MRVAGEVVGLHLGGCLHFFGTGVGALLVEQGPGDGGDDQAAGDLDDGQGDAEEAQQGGADKVDDDQEEERY